MSKPDHLTHIAATIAAGLIQAQGDRAAGGLPDAKRAVDTYEAVLKELENRLAKRKAAEEANAKTGKKELPYQDLGLV
jgi:hypothetical protein